MDFYIARQPIFTVHKRVFAYELLYRGYKGHKLNEVNGNKATTSLLSSAFLTEGISIISGTKPCFINFTEELLEKDIAASFPHNQVVIEVLEDVQPTPQIISILKKLKAKGYKIALDDFVYDRKLEPLIALAEIIKIDVRLTPLEAIHKTLHKLSRHNVKLLAEKVESLEEFERANKLGFHYFQGYFFSKPENILVKELESAKINLFNLLAEVTKKTTSLKRLHKIISVDLAISYKLLRFLNSAYFYRLEKVKSVKHAIAFLGEKELRRFIILVIISHLATDKPGELVRLSLVRAKFCELLAKKSDLAHYDSEIFLVGLLSFIDIMLENEMKSIMDKLPVIDPIKDALTSHSGIFFPFLDAVIAYEKRQDDQFNAILEELKIDTDGISEVYLQSVTYSNSLT